ncbi:MAG: alpha/beta fold hydrolase [Nitrospira sp.]
MIRRGADPARSPVNNKAHARRLFIGGACVILAWTLFSGPAEADHKVAHCRPDPAEALFPAEFPALLDHEWQYRLGGWGGQQPGASVRHRPVIFVHGNTRDAGDWDEPADSVKRRFLEAGYSPQELWALSYNGKATKRAPPAAQCRTDTRSNTSDLAAFIKAVLAYTGAAKVDLIGHSLGVMIIRSVLTEHQDLLPHVDHVVAIAGPNHGTTVCRRLWLIWLIGWSDFVGCDELVPGSDWLRRLNGPGGERETPGPARYMTIYDGTGADIFYRSWLFGWPVGDADSPTLDGADNRRLPGLTHDELRTDEQAVALYLQFVSDQSSPNLTKNLLSKDRLRGR